VIGRWFGRRDSTPELPPELGPLQVAIGGALVLDTLGLQASLSGGQPAMGAPLGGPFLVAAVGTAELDADNRLTRYYDDDNRMLQVIAPPGKEAERAVDVSLYAPWDSVVPAGRADWEAWTGASGLIGAASYNADGIEFARYWGEGDGRAPLVEFVETVADGTTTRRIHQSCMLYSRAVGAGEEMLLLNIERDLDQRAAREGAAIEFLIGYGLGPADVRRV